MWRFPTAAAICAVTVLMPAPAAAQHMPGAPPVDFDRSRAEYNASVIREYNVLMHDWRASLDKGEAGQTAAFYTEGAVMLVSGADAVQGRTAIRELLDGMLPQIVELRTGLTDFVASDNLAYATGPIILDYRVTPTASVRSVRGHHVTVLVRENRRWRIRSQVLQYDDDQAPPRAPARQ